MRGILLVDKPSGMTSHDVVDCIRKATGIRRVGHTGTLDPAATGLLILCLGTATRLSDFLVGMDKTYEGTLLLGTVSASHDLDGEILEENEVPDLTAEDVQNVFDDYTGVIMQVPPMVSAVKVGGKRLYKLAREGKTVEREARPVTVREFSLLNFESPRVAFRMSCTRGTYARTLCHDVGAVLGCGGALAELRRTHVGQHAVADAGSLDSFKTPEDVTARLIPMENALDLPDVIVRSFGKKTVASGGTLGRHDLSAECPVEAGWVQVKTEGGELLAVGEVHKVGQAVQIQPKRVFCGKR